MRKIPLNEVKDELSRYLHEAVKEEIGISARETCGSVDRVRY